LHFIGGCKKVIITQNDDCTSKIEFTGCKLIYDGREVEANIVFPKVSGIDASAVSEIKDFHQIYEFSTGSIDEDQTIYTICIPE